MTGGLLLFEDSARGSWTAGCCFGGLTTLERGILTMARAGVDRLLVAVPPGLSPAAGRRVRRLDIDLEIAAWGDSPRTTFGPSEEVLVLLGDHVHHHSSLTALVESGASGDGLVVQVSPAPGQEGLTFLPPAVATGGGDGGMVSTGALLCDGSLQPHQLVGRGGSALEFLRGLAAGRGVRTTEGDPSLWRRVEDRRGARQAKAMLFGQVTKKTSGPVSRHINARLSIPISKVLVETGLSPHLVTVLFVLTTGLAAAWLISDPEPYWRLALAGFLWQMAAVLDRCDGEIARVKLCESRFGAWFDTVTDNLAYVAAYAAFLKAAHGLHPGQPLYLYAGLSAVAAMFLSLGIMYHYALRTGSGSLQNYIVGFARHVPREEKGALYRALERYALLSKRDSFAFVHFVLALLGAFDLIYLFTVGGLHLFAVGVLLSQGKMLAAHRRRSEAAAEGPPPEAGGR